VRAAAARLASAIGPWSVAELAGYDSFGQLRRQAAVARRAPSAYQDARNVVNANGRGSVHLSVAPGDLSVAHLICLARTLRAARSDWQDVVVLVFDSHPAAPGWVGTTTRIRVR